MVGSTSIGPWRWVRVVSLAIVCVASARCVTSEACNNDGNCRDGQSCVAGVCEDACKGESCPAENACVPDGPGEECDDAETCTIDSCDGTGACRHDAAPAETVCGASRDECDLVERCVADAGVCSADASLADGVACSVGQCAGGVCVPADIASLRWYLKLDEASGDVAYDTSSTGLDASIVNAARQSGQLMGALAFQGLDSFAVADDLQYGSEGTIALWFSTTQGPPGPGTAVLYGHGGTGPSNVAIFFDVAGNLSARVRGVAGNANLQAFGSFRDGAWHHVALAFADGSPPRLYVDGALNVTATTPVQQLDPASRIVLGASEASALVSNFFVGAVDDVRVYTRALGNGETLGLYRAQNGATPITVRAEADTYVQGGAAAGENFSDTNKLVIKNDPNLDTARYGYVRFDVSGMADIASAQLRLTVTENGLIDPGVIEHTIYAVTDDSWSEYTLTWNTQPAVGEAITTFEVPAVGGVAVIDLTDAVRTAAAGDGRLSLSIRSSADLGSQDFAWFASREIEVGPRLDVAW